MGLSTEELIAWAVRGGLVLSVMLITWWARDMTTRLNDHDKLRMQGYQRLSVLESHYEDIDRRLERIERKIDTLNGKH